MRSQRIAAARAAGCLALVAGVVGLVAGLGPAGAAAAKGEPEAKAGAAKPGPASPQTWYAEAIGRGPSGAIMSHFWSKGSLFRAEVVIGGHRIVTIVNGEYYYTIDSLTGSGVGIRRAPAAVSEDAGRVRPFGTELEEMLAAGAERVKVEELGGRSCDLYRLTDDLGRRSVCADTERGLPLHFERYNRATGDTEEVSYLSWLSGMAIPDLFFEPDPRFQIERMSLEDYASRSRREAVGPAPALYGSLLFGKRGRR